MNHGSHEISDGLLRRIEALETPLAKTRKRRTLERAVLGTSLLVLAGGIFAGFTAANTTNEVLRAKRLEIVDDANRVVLLATVSDTGGRLDFWDAEGRNCVRVGANTTGGDLALWNTNGDQVFAAFASGRTGKLEVNGPSGAPSTILTSDANGGVLKIMA